MCTVVCTFGVGFSSHARFPRTDFAPSFALNYNLSFAVCLFPMPHPQRLIKFIPSLCLCQVLTIMTSFPQLDRTLRQIRIVEISPGKQDESISCCHEISSIDVPPEYEALSYTWGSPTPTQSIILNGSPYQVPLSLNIALHHLRKPNVSRKL